MSSVSKDVEGGLAIYSRIKTTIGFVIVVILFFVAMAVGIHELRDKHTEISIGVISKATCNPNKDAYNCDLTIDYSVAGNTYTILSSKNSNYALQKGDTIPVRYDPQNPRNGITGPAPKYIGYGIIGVALFVLILSSVNIYFVYKSESYAAVTGGISAVGTVARVL